MRRIVYDGPLKERRLIEAELTLVRDQLVTSRRGWQSPLKMRGAAAALEWVLSDTPSPAPLSRERRDPRVRVDVRAEAAYAEEVVHYPTRFSELADLATRPGMDLPAYATGINEELAWVLGGSEQTALALLDDELDDEVEDLA